MSDETEDRPSNVVAITFGRETEIKDSGPSNCRHWKMDVDRKTRTITCGTCGQPLDPFDIMWKYATDERMFRHWEGQSRELRKRIAELEEQERKIKARTRAANRKEAEAAVAEERNRSAEKRRRTEWNAKQIMELAERIVNANTDTPPKRKRVEQWRQGSYIYTVRARADGHVILEWMGGLKHVTEEELRDGFTRYPGARRHA